MTYTDDTGKLKATGLHTRIFLITVITLIGCGIHVDQAFSYNRTKTCLEDQPDSVFACEKGQKAIPLSWPTGCVPIRLHQSIDPTSEFGLAIRAAMDTWNDVACSYLKLQYAGTTDQETPGYDQLHKDNGNFNITVFQHDWGERSPRIVAITSISYGLETGHVYDADIAFNSEYYSFSTFDEPSKTSPNIDVQNVATHELGHVAGLDHPTTETLVGAQKLSNTTMYADTLPGEIKQRSLEEDDIAGICNIYPRKNAPNSECKTLSPNFQRGPTDFTAGRITETQQGCGCTSTRSGNNPPTILIFIALSLLGWRKYL